MAFPTSPTNGQTTTQNGQLYTYSSALGAWTLTTSTTGTLSGTSVTVTGNITGGNVLVGSGIISTAGNVSTGNIIVSGTISDASQLDILTTTSNANIVLTPNGTGNVNTPANVSVTGNITGGNIVTAGLISAGSNITGGNLLTAGLISASGNVIGLSFSDSNGLYNVNLGGTNGRGAVAGYSGGAYGGVGYNITHTSSSAVYNKPSADQTSYLRFDNGGFNFLSNTGTTAGSSITLTSRMVIDSSGMVTPGTTAAQDLGSASLRWRNVYTSDLHLNNGIGNYTIVEGEDDLFLYNNRNGKTYKFALTEVDPATMPPKMKED